MFKVFPICSACDCLNNNENYMHHQYQFLKLKKMGFEGGVHKSTHIGVQAT